MTWPDAANRELHHDPAAQVWLLRQLLLVAVLHLVDVAPDDPADDLLVELSADVGDAGDHVGRARAPTAQPAGAAAVARAVAGRTSPPPFPIVPRLPRPMRALAGATAAHARADHAQPTDSVCRADLVADQAAEHVRRVVAERAVAAEHRRGVAVLPRLDRPGEVHLASSEVFSTPRMPALRACSSATCGPGLSVEGRIATGAGDLEAEAPVVLLGLEHQQ